MTNLQKLPNETYKEQSSKMRTQIKIFRIKITKNEYSKLYPTGSNPGKFYGPAKIHNRSYNGTIDQLPLKLIVSSEVTISAYPIRVHTVKNFKEPIQKCKNVVLLDSNSKVVSYR